MLEFLLAKAGEHNVWLIILGTGIVTYITRSSGHMVLARFKNLHPRVVMGLEAVPAAVLVTIVIPPVLNNGPVELVAMFAALVASFRLPPLAVLAIGLGIIIAGRMIGF